MAHSTTPRLRGQIHRLFNPPAPQREFGLDGILETATVESFLKQEAVHWKEILYTPLLTFWAFFWQMLTPTNPAAPR